MIKLGDYLKRDLVWTDVASTEKASLLQELVHRTASAGFFDNEEVILTLLRKREELSSTGIGEGIAIPHTTAHHLSDTLVALAKLREGIDFEAKDGRPIQFCFLVVGPPRNQPIHLQLLASIARLYKTEACRERLRAAASPEELLAAIQEFEETRN